MLWQAIIIIKNAQEKKKWNFVALTNIMIDKEIQDNHKNVAIILSHIFKVRGVFKA